MLQPRKIVLDRRPIAGRDRFYSPLNNWFVTKPLPTYIINVNIIQWEAPTTVGYPPCPRANAWVEGHVNHTQYTYLTSVTSHTYNLPTSANIGPYDSGRGADAGVDVFRCAASGQVVTIEYDGQPFAYGVTEALVEGNTQIKTQLMYHTPGTYNVDVYLTRYSCNSPVIDAGGQSSWFTGPSGRGLSKQTMFLGEASGQFRIKGAHGKAPDRHIMKFVEDGPINWNTNSLTGVWDTGYIGSTGSSGYPNYMTQIQAAHCALPASYRFECVGGVPSVNPITWHAGADNFDTESAGMFDLVFDKPAGKRFLDIWTLAGQNIASTAWAYKTWCTEPYRTSLFGWALKGRTGVNSNVSTIPPVTGGHPLITASSITRSGLGGSSSRQYWDAWYGTGAIDYTTLPAAKDNTYIQWSATVTGTTTATLTSMRGPWLGTDVGNLTAALIYSTNSLFSTYSTLMSAAVSSTDGFTIDGNWRNRYDNYQNMANAYLSANPIIIKNGQPAYFRIVTYGSPVGPGSIRVYDNSPYDKGESIAFYGAVVS